MASDENMVTVGEVQGHTHRLTSSPGSWQELCWKAGKTHQGDRLFTVKYYVISLLCILTIFIDFCGSLAVLIVYSLEGKRVSSNFMAFV